MTYSRPAAMELWMFEGPCNSTDPEIFFPTLGASHATTTAQALAVCKQCPVRERCLEYALDNFEQGIWGGMTENQRTRMRRARDAA